MNKEKILNDITRILEINDYEANSWHPDTVEELIDESVSNKKNVLEKLRKHPDWNEDELCIVFRDSKKERVFNRDAIISFINYSYTFWGVNPQDRFHKAMAKIKFASSPFFTEKDKELVDEINSINPEYKIHYTGKLSKVILKICKEEGLDKMPDFEKRYAKLSDEISPKREIITEVISLNPVDFLSMSGGNSWSSCHNIFDGEYMAGTLSYMLDDVSFVYFQIPNDTPEEEIHTVRKLKRQMWMYSDQVLASSRLYPQSNDTELAKNVYEDIRNTVLDTFSKCLNVQDYKNPWLTSYSQAKKILVSGEGSAAYPDWEEYNPGSKFCTISKLRTRAIPIPTIWVGTYPRCINCGREFEETDRIICSSCR